MAKRRTDRIHAGTAESKQRILDAALALAATRGYEGTTVSLISKYSGLPMGSVYWHFDNKDKLFATLLEQTFENWQSHLQNNPTDTREEGWQALVSAITGAVVPNDADDQWQSSQGSWHLGLLLALERRMETTLARQRFLDIRNRARKILTDQCTRALPEEVVANTPGLAARIANLIMATVDGLYISESADETGIPSEVIKTLIDAIGALLEEQIVHVGG